MDRLKGKLVEWKNMDCEEKRKYNGYNGFIKGELFKDNNLFMTETKLKLRRKLYKDRQLRRSQI